MFALTAEPLPLTTLVGWRPCPLDDLLSHGHWPHWLAGGHVLWNVFWVTATDHTGWLEAMSSGMFSEAPPLTILVGLRPCLLECFLGHRHWLYWLAGGHVLWNVYWGTATDYTGWLEAMSSGIFFEAPPLTILVGWRPCPLDDLLSHGHWPHWLAGGHVLWNVFWVTATDYAGWLEAMSSGMFSEAPPLTILVGWRPCPLECFLRHLHWLYWLAGGHVLWNVFWGTSTDYTGWLEAMSSGMFTEAPPLTILVGWRPCPLECFLRHRLWLYWLAGGHVLWMICWAMATDHTGWLEAMSSGMFSESRPLTMLVGWRPCPLECLLSHNHWAHWLAGGHVLWNVCWATATEHTGWVEAMSSGMYAEPRPLSTLVGWRPCPLECLLSHGHWAHWLAGGHVLWNVCWATATEHTGWLEAMSSGMFAEPRPLSTLVGWRPCPLECLLSHGHWAHWLGGGHVLWNVCWATVTEHTGWLEAMSSGMFAEPRSLSTLVGWRPCPLECLLSQGHWAHWLGGGHVLWNVGSVVLFPAIKLSTPLQRRKSWTSHLTMYLILEINSEEKTQWLRVWMVQIDEAFTKFPMLGNCRAHQQHRQQRWRGVYWIHLVCMSVCPSICLSIRLYTTWFPEHKSSFLWSFNLKFHVHDDYGHGQKPLDFQWSHFQNGCLAAILDILVSRL